MRISSSSIFITFIISTIMIIIFNGLLKNKRNYHFFRIDFLSILGTIIFLRLLFPVEFIFTFTLEAPIFMNPIQNILWMPIYNHLTIHHFVILIWLAVSICLFVYYVILLIKINNSTKKVILNSKKISVIWCKHPIYETSYVNVPTIFATKKAIFLPESLYSEQEMKDILLHESQHIKNHDLLIKQLINILNIIYWWNPFVYMYKNQIQLLLEMRVDSKITDVLSNYESLLYTQSLISVQKKTLFIKNNSDKALSTNLIDENENILAYRINYLLENNFKHKTSKLLLCSLFLIPFLANSIILEPSFEPINNNEYYEINDFKNGYITKEKNGSYKLHIQDTTIIIQNPKSSEFKNLPIFDVSKENN